MSQKSISIYITTKPNGASIPQKVDNNELVVNFNVEGFILSSDEYMKLKSNIESMKAIINQSD